MLSGLGDNENEKSSDSAEEVDFDQMNLARQNSRS
jgi:hypothetical protein